MDIRRISETYAVSPQISASDMAAIAEAGFDTVICNRPDSEIPPGQQSQAIKSAAEAAGLNFVFLPVTYETLNEGAVRRQTEAISEAGGPVLAYCASGTRSSVIWSYAQLDRLSVDEIMMATAKAGYDLAGLRPRLEAMASGA